MRFLLLLTIFFLTSSCLESNTSTNFELKQKNDFALKLAEVAYNLTKDFVIYDASYFQIEYPNGDIPANKGVCTDVIIRAYRKLGIDLQKEVHEDMKINFHLYPKKWGLKSTDTNIDHRRVPNLMIFFSRKGKKKAITKNESDYLPGDIITWNLNNGATHIGLVSSKKTFDGKRYKIVHNIGYGQQLSDCLFDYEITGHYTYRG